MITAGGAGGDGGAGLVVSEISAGVAVMLGMVRSGISAGGAGGDDGVTWLSCMGHSLRCSLFFLFSSMLFVQIRVALRSGYSGLAPPCHHLQWLANHILTSRSPQLAAITIRHHR